MTDRIIWESAADLNSPVSPVLATIEALCEWCATGATTFGSNRASAEAWRKMLDADFVAHVEGNAVFM